MSHQWAPVRVQDKWETSVDETTKHAGPGEACTHRWTVPRRWVELASVEYARGNQGSQKGRLEAGSHVPGQGGLPKRLSKDLQKVRGELCRSQAWFLESLEQQRDQSSRDEVRKVQCQERRNHRGQVQGGLGDHSKVGLHSRAVWTLQSRRGSLVLLQKGDSGELPTAQPHRAAVVGRGLDAGDICTAVQPCWL